MPKIIQITSCGDFLFALSENGEVYKTTSRQTTIGYTWSKLPPLPDNK